MFNRFVNRQQFVNTNSWQAEQQLIGLNFPQDKQSISTYPSTVRSPYQPYEKGDSLALMHLQLVALPPNG